MPTIESATAGKTLDANATRGPLVVWSVKLDDGRTAEILRKPDSGAPSGEVTVEDGPHGLKAKLVQQPGRGGGRTPDPREMRGRNASTALSYSKDLCVGGKIETDQIGAYAKKFYDFIESKARVDS